MAIDFKQTLYAALVSLGIFVMFFFLGDAALRLFGVDIQSFAVAGSSESSFLP